MAKIKAPLFSLDASGTLDKTLTYRKKPQNNTASKYSKPGSVNPFESSPRQKDQRSIIGLITACWQSKTNLDKLSWDASAKAARFKGSGYHYFLHLAKTDLKTYLGLVGFWSMNYSNGDSVPDLSGNNNHGILSPIYPCDCPQPVDSINKKNGKAYIFDGIDDYISIAHSPTLNITAQISIEALIYTGNISQDSYFITKTIPPATRAYSLKISVNNITFLLWNSVGSLRYVVSNPGFIENNKWYYVVALHNSTNDIILYINNIKQTNTSNISDIRTLDSPLYFGTLSNSFFFDGIIDNISIWNRSPSQQEIQRRSSLFI